MTTTEPIRILVFGETGTGKTSACNALSGQKMPTSNSAVGVTFQSHNYLPFIKGDNSYILTDTIGLNESDKGTVKATEAFKNLLELIKNSSNGYNLLIHVARGRITKSLQDNYKFFVETVAQKKIPVILIVTNCEGIEPMSLWEEENRVHFEKQGLDYMEVIATCFGETEIQDFKPRFDRLRKESSERVMAAVEKYAKVNAVPLYKKENGFLSFLKRLWNGLCELYDVSEWKIRVNESIINLLLRVGFNKDEAEKLAKKWSLKK